MSRDAPKTVAELLRGIVRRLNRLEGPQTVWRIGGWSLAEDSAGNLVARHGEVTQVVAFRGTGDRGAV